MSTISNIPVSAAEPRQIMVRGFVAPAHVSTGRKAKRKASEVASPWSLVFDTETTTDAAQNLRFGCFQLRKRHEIAKQGLFYNPAAMTKAEVGLLHAYAEEQGLELLTVRAFCADILWRLAYQLRASIIGFNLPFDLSRVAFSFNSARGKAMKGGFTFRLDESRYSPYVQIKHLNARAALIQYALPKEAKDTRGQRRRGQCTKGRRGAFVDLKTVAAALFSRSFSLGSLAAFLKTVAQKHETGEHGGPLTRDYIAYAVQDVQTTWECYVALQQAYQRHDLTKPIGKILSEASLGKAYLEDMGVRPFFKIQPDFPPELTGQIMSTYYGGRSEVHLRRVKTQVLYCDFLSMYPTVCTLMGLWRFAIASGMDWRDETEAVRALLASAKPENFQKQDAWKQLHLIVQLKPEADILPVRAKYDGTSATIGVNHLTSDQPLWYTLADVLASKFLSGKTPVIQKAIRFVPREPQAELNPIAIARNEDYLIRPAVDDFYKRLIDMRSTVKARMKTATGEERDALDAEQLALKLLANSTSYGIFVELIATEEKDHERLCYGVQGEGFAIDKTTVQDKVEDPGPYFHPLLATLITGAARLMLALAEREILHQGLDWAFCDTDSMAIAKPEGMDGEEFFAKAQAVCTWFDPLNPYEQQGGLFKIEDANYGIGSTALAPLYAYCISSKRYVLFNLAKQGAPIIRKASAHGLGHFIAPYGANDPGPAIPPPCVPLKDIGVDLWHHDLWHQIVRAVLGGHPAQVDLSYHPALKRPAPSRYSATTPELLRWFQTFNAGNPPGKQIKPFNFILAFQAKQRTDWDQELLPEAPRRGRPKKSQRISPVAPFTKDIAKAARTAFDRNSGEGIEPGNLKTYEEALAQYHLRSESKFLGGEFLDSGPTRRRQIEVLDITHIGKESNAWEEQYYLQLDEDAVLDLGSGDPDKLMAVMGKLAPGLSQRARAKRLGIPRGTFAKYEREGLEALSPAAQRMVKQRLAEGTQAASRKKT